MYTNNLSMHTSINSNNNNTSILQMNAPESPTKKTAKKNSVEDWLEGIIRFTFTYTAYILLAFAPLKIYQTTRAPLKFSSQIHFPYTLCASISLSLSISFSHAEHSPLNVHRFHIFNALTWPWLLRIQWEQRSAHTLNVARADPGMSYDSEFHQ